MHIVKSTKKQTEKSTKKSLIDDLSKRLLELEYKSNHSIKSKCLKWILKKILPFEAYVKKQDTYCLRCKKRTDNNSIIAKLVVNRLITQKSICPDCGAIKSVFGKEYKPNKKQK